MGLRGAKKVIRAPRSANLGAIASPAAQPSFPFACLGADTARGFCCVGGGREPPDFSAGLRRAAGAGLCRVCRSGEAGPGGPAWTLQEEWPWGIRVVARNRAPRLR